LETSFTEAGTGLIQARLTDPTGNQSLSAPIGIRVVNYWHNQRDPFEVDGLGFVSGLDVLLPTNYINSHLNVVPLPLAPLVVSAFCDVNNDGYCTASDVLAVFGRVNELIGESAEGELLDIGTHGPQFAIADDGWAADEGGVPQPVPEPRLADMDYERVPAEFLHRLDNLTA
jgi:hypothetical protein